MSALPPMRWMRWMRAADAADACRAAFGDPACLEIILDWKGAARTIPTMIGARARPTRTAPTSPIWAA
jgi:hypothetical protein